MNLDEIALKYKTDKASYSHNYTKYYDMLFNQYRIQPINLLEIGVAAGASLNMWQEYFPLATINAIDAAATCKIFEKERIHIFIGDQSDSNFLTTTIDKIGNPDIIIDDGSHVSYQQIISFQTLFPLLKKGGIYVIEDLHTSYQKNFLIRSPVPATNFLKDLVDDVNMRGKSNHSNKYSIIQKIKDSNIILNDYEKTIEGMYFFPGICFIQKMKE